MLVLQPTSLLIAQPSAIKLLVSDLSNSVSAQVCLVPLCHCLDIGQQSEMGGLSPVRC